MDNRSIEILNRWRDEHMVKMGAALALASKAGDADSATAFREVADYHRQQADICTARLNGGAK